jgi:hypothetical protein
VRRARAHADQEKRAAALLGAQARALDCEASAAEQELAVVRRQIVSIAAEADFGAEPEPEASPGGVNSAPLDGVVTMMLRKAVALMEAAQALEDPLDATAYYEGAVGMFDAVLLSNPECQDAVYGKAQAVKGATWNEAVEQRTASEREDCKRPQRNMRGAKFLGHQNYD